ncbi:DoxX family protein [Actinacidiphila alni]|uniref:DoxX family protein n=1 Tax=Actinacidiphila alni TaxID=380248 RepID=UPI0033E6CEE9
MTHTAATATTTAVPPAAATGTAASVATRTGSGRARASLMGLQIVLALFYAFASAAPKLLGLDAAADSFDRIGFGDWFMYLTGALEFAGAVALVIPVLYQVAAVAMIGLMIGATVTQITVFDGRNVATPVILILPLAVIAWARGDSTTALLALLRRAVDRT